MLRPFWLPILAAVFSSPPALGIRAILILRPPPHYAVDLLAARQAARLKLLCTGKATQGWARRTPPPVGVSRNGSLFQSWGRLATGARAFGHLVALALLLVSLQLLSACGAETPRSPAAPIPTPTRAIVQPVGPPIASIWLPNPVLDVGDVEQKAPLTVEVDIGNTGSTAIQILNLGVTRRVTLATPLPSNILPGGSSRLRLTVDTSAPGELNEVLMMSSNDRSQPILELRLVGDVIPVSIKAVPRLEKGFEQVTGTEPKFVVVTGTNGYMEWSFQHWLPRLTSFVVIDAVNSGPGEAEIELVVSLTGASQNMAAREAISLRSGERRSVSVSFPVNWLTQVVGAEYDWRFERATEQVATTRQVLDIIKVTPQSETRLDSLDENSLKAKTWKESDYHSPSEISRIFPMSGSPADAASDQPSVTPRR